MVDRAGEGTLAERYMVRLVGFVSYAAFHALARNDAKTVAIVAAGCFHPVTKVQSASLYFFLGEENHESEDDTEEVCKLSIL